MKFLGQSFLDGVNLFEVLVVSVLGVSVRVYQSLHGDDGSRATQVVLVFDGDAELFHDPSNGGTTRFVAFTSPSAGTWGADEVGLHGEGVVGCEFFIGIQFGGESLEIRVQLFTPLLEFTYCEGGGLESVTKGTGLHGEMDGGVRSKSGVRGNLLLDGPLEGPGEFFP